jgi:hypothetical protein
MNFSALILGVFGFTAITVFFFWVNIQRIYLENRSQLLDASRELLPEYAKRIRRYRTKMYWSAAIGASLLFILYLLHGIGLLLPEAK